MEDFLGQEIEFAENFVRLGDIEMTYPDYTISKPSFEYYYSNLFIPEIHLFPGYYDSPDDLFSSILGSSDDMHFIRARIKYPEYPQLWFQGSFLDPLATTDYIFNPLFKTLVMLDDNHMLIGSGD